MGFDVRGLFTFDVITIPETTLPPTMRGKAVAAIGDVIVLHKPYDPRQLWLPYMQGVILINQERAEDNCGELGVWGPKPVSAFSIFNLGSVSDPTRNTASFESVDTRNQYSYLYYEQPPLVRGVDQYVLPFVETKRINTTDMSQLRFMGFPGFDRDENGDLFSYTLKPSDHGRIGEWAEQNCQGRYAINEGYLYVEREEDAIAMRLLI
jgi:hypothetical protein